MTGEELISQSLNNPYNISYYAIIARHDDKRWLGRPQAHVWKVFTTYEEALDFYIEQTCLDWTLNIEEVKITPIE